LAGAKPLAVDSRHQPFAVHGSIDTREACFTPTVSHLEFF